MLRRLSTLSVIMAIVLLSVTATSISDRKVAVAAYETNAYDLRAAFHDGWEPHYGAFFSPIGPGWNARFVGACNACQSSGGCPNTWGGGVLTEMYYWCLKATGYGDHLRGVDNGTGQIIERHLIEVDSQPLQFGGKL